MYKSQWNYVVIMNCKISIFCHAYKCVAVVTCKYLKVSLNEYVFMYVYKYVHTYICM